MSPQFVSKPPVSPTVAPSFWRNSLTALPLLLVFPPGGGGRATRWVVFSSCHGWKKKKKKEPSEVRQEFTFHPFIQWRSTLMIRLITSSKEFEPLRDGNAGDDSEIPRKIRDASFSIRVSLNICWKNNRKEAIWIYKEILNDWIWKIQWQRKGTFDSTIGWRQKEENFHHQVITSLFPNQD